MDLHYNMLYETIHKYRGASPTNPPSPITIHSEMSLPPQMQNLRILRGTWRLILTGLDEYSAFVSHYSAI